METLKERDKNLTVELGIKSLSRLIGYNEAGEPIELVYDAQSGEYEWHIGGEYMKDATQQSIEAYVNYFNRCPLV